jgi:uncharacterized protein (TIGR03083 family)
MSQPNTHAPRRERELNAVPWLREERGSFLALLDGLADDDWQHETECPGWTVHGIALHVLGNDLSLLSRQRDASPSGLIPVAQRRGARDLAGLLDVFNQEWVSAASFLSPRLVIELLELTGDWTAEWFDKVPGDRLGEPVPWMGPEPAPYFLVAAREYVERWVHHHQIARATDSKRPDDATTLHAVEALAPGFPRLLAPLHAPDDAIVGVTVLDRSWTLSGPGGGWAVQSGQPASSTAEIALVAPDIAARAFSRGLTASEMTEAVEARGDAELASDVTQLFVEAFSSSY